MRARVLRRYGAEYLTRGSTIGAKCGLVFNWLV